MEQDPQLELNLLHLDELRLDELHLDESQKNDNNTNHATSNASDLLFKQHQFSLATEFINQSNKTNNQQDNANNQQNNANNQQNNGSLKNEENIPKKVFDTVDKVYRDSKYKLYKNIAFSVAVGAGAGVFVLGALTLFGFINFSKDN